MGEKTRMESGSKSIDLAQEDLWQSLVYLPFIPNVFDKLYYRKLLPTGMRKSQVNQYFQGKVN